MEKYKTRLMKLLLIICVLLFQSITAYSDNSLKREFRGAWIQCVNGQFLGMSTQKCRKHLLTS